jgi:hypothetical protein
MTKQKTQKRKILRMTKNRIKQKNTNQKNKTQKEDNLKKVRCSPKDKTEMNDFTCYTDKNLYKLRDLWNARHTDVQIMTNDPKEIHNNLTKYMSNVCSKESCWLKQNFMDNKTINELTDSFAPVSPKEWKKNPNEWLSSVDIMKVMKQYENAYKCFDFIGPTPIDFDTKMLYGECVWDELCNFSLAEQIKKGKTKIGIIFNTDPHDKPGQHWISMFINIKKKKIFFFDSVGDKAPKEIMVLVNRIIKQGKKINMNMKFDQNHPVEHQYGDTECGIYSLFFISHMLEDKFTEHYMKTHILKDDYMHKFRKVYFNESLV